MGTTNQNSKPKAYVAVNKIAPTHPDVQIPRAEVGRIFDKIMTGTSLVLALHRLEEAKRDCGLATPGELICWQAFLALSEACDELGHHAGYEPHERGPE